MTVSLPDGDEITLPDIDGCSVKISTGEIVDESGDEYTVAQLREAVAVFTARWEAVLRWAEQCPKAE